MQQLYNQSISNGDGSCSNPSSIMNSSMMNSSSQSSCAHISGGLRAQVQSEVSNPLTVGRQRLNMSMNDGTQKSINSPNNLLVLSTATPTVRLLSDKTRKVINEHGKKKMGPRDSKKSHDYHQDDRSNLGVNQNYEIKSTTQKLSASDMYKSSGSIQSSQYRNSESL